MGTETRDFGPIEYEGFSLTGQYEYEPEQPATHDDPGIGAIVSVVSVYIDGSKRDAIEIIDPGVVQILEDLIANGLPTCGDASYDEGPAFDEYRFEREAA